MDNLTYRFHRSAEDRPIDLTVHELESSSTWGVWRIARALVSAMRPQQWTKNIIVFAAPAFALKFDRHTAVYTTLAFIAFCAISAATYLINDVHDMHADRAHPIKRNRPIAAGVLPAPFAMGVAGLLVAGSVALSLALEDGLVWAVGTYGALQLGYNVGLKRQPIVDVLIISAGFVTRALGGAAAASVQVSTWFLLCVALLALFLAIEKRRAELRAVGEAAATRLVLKSYSESLLARMGSVVTACGLMSYSLWAAQRTPRHWLLATVPIVAYVLFKYQMLTEQGAGEEPDTVLVKSPAIVLAIIIWIASCMAILLLQGHGAPWNVCTQLC